MNTSNATTNHHEPAGEELFALVPCIVGLDAANDAHGFGLCSDCRACPAVDASGFCEACGSVVVPAPGRERCPAGCFGGYVEDPHGQSKHNPTGLRPCPVCG